jgi:predicted PurR-regulated permease PerM
MIFKTNLYGAQKLAYALLSVVILVYISATLQEILVPLLFAGLFSFLLYPVCSKLEKFGFPRVLAIVLAILVASMFLSVFFYWSYTQIIQLESLVPVLIDKGTDLVSKIERFVNINYQLDQAKVLAEGKKYFSEILNKLPTMLSGTLSTTSSFLMNFAILPLYIFLFLLYRDFLKTFVVKLLSNTSKHKIEMVMHKINSVVQSYIVGLVLVILIVGILNTACLLLLDIEHAVFFGFFASVLVLIPYIGIAIGSFLPIFVAFITKDSYLYPAGVAMSFFVIQFLEGNFITPFIVGSKVSINSLAAILALLLFGSLWGLSGLVLALPLTAVLKVIFDSVDSLKAFGFLLGDADHTDVKELLLKSKTRNILHSMTSKIEIFKKSK